MFQKKRVDLLNTGFNPYEADLIRKKAREVGEREGFSWEDKEKKFGKILTLTEALPMFGFQYSKDLMKYVQEGVFDKLGFVLYIGKDILPKSGNESLAVFIKKGIEDFNKNYKPLSAIAQDFGFDYTSLNAYNARGKLDAARFHPEMKRWNVQWIKENYPKIREEGIKTRRAKTTGKRKDYFSMLNKEQQTWINNYCEHRRNHRVIFGGKKFEPFATKEAWIEHRDELARLFYLAICAKSHIERYWETNARGYYRTLSPEELKKFNPDKFNVFHFSSEELLSMLKNKQSPHARYSVRKYLQPFFYFILMKQKEQIRSREIKEGRLLTRERAMLDAWAESLEEAFEKYTPITKELRKKKYQKVSQPITDGTTSGVSVFLDRIDIVRLIKRVFTDTKMYDPIKYAAMLVLGFFAVIRPSEMRRMKIERHLVTDSKTGLLKTFTINGVEFGKIIITEDISKKGISPSGIYDLLLVPQAVKYLNLYLQRLYKKHPHTKGRGYLFRPFDMEHDPEQPYADSGTMFKWIRDHKNKFRDILTDDQVEHFSSYDPRHTGNNLITKKTFFSNPAEESLKREVAKYHCRHWGDSEINEEHYQERFTLDMYAHIIHTALGFPFDEKELLQWEQKMLSGYNQQSVSEQEAEETENIGTSQQTSRLSKEPLETIRDIDQEIDKLRKEIAELGKKSNEKYYEEQGLDFHKRLEKAKELQMKINELEKQKHLILRGVHQ